MLNQDMVISFKSVSMVNGHAGTEVRYLAASREAVYTSWCTQEKKQFPFGKKTYETTKNEDRLSIPREIDTEEALRDYISREKLSWIL